MPTRFCLTCGADISAKRADARFCGEACRKYFKRKGTRIRSRRDLQLPKPDKSRLARTPRPGPSLAAPRKRAGSSFEHAFSQVYRGSRNLLEATLGGIIAETGDIVAQKVKCHVLPPTEAKPPPPPTAEKEASPAKEKPPLTGRTAQDLLGEEPKDSIPLPEVWRAFLGETTHPFKMLVWGLPGSGKSTFALQLLDALNTTTPTLYVSGEEALDSATLISRVRRTMQHPQHTLMIDRVPESTEDWYSVGWVEQAEQFRRAIAFDSLTALGLTPFHHRDSLQALLDESTGKDIGFTRLATLLLMSEQTSLIWITHAQKDGKAYLGESSWAHEADIVVRCEEGQATTLKNRFGMAGATFTIF